VRIEVETGTLSAEGAGHSQLAGQIAELAGELARASSAACAAGDPHLSAAIDGCLATWSQALGMLAGSVEGLGTNLGGAANAYTVTDRGAMPAGAP
jgi:Excreted virulence factor EspC, type VII ESX diderm